jgi:hypothetical protein
MVARAAFKAKLEELIDVYGSTGKAWQPKIVGIPHTSLPEF